MLLTMTRLLPCSSDNDNGLSDNGWAVPGQSPAGDPKYLLEMARVFSIEHHSHLVLCRHFLPGLDLLVSADDDGWSPLQSNAVQVDARCREVIDLVERTGPVMRQRTEWCRAVMSFGLVRWWPVPLREKATHSLGPFHIVIDCRAPHAPVVHIDEESLMASD
jgi:hypothetical protein